MANNETKIKNGITELVFILDRSGSMQPLTADTVGGFNAMIEKQKKLGGKCFVSTVLFDSKSEVLHDRVPLEEIKPMTEDDYSVGGCTALIDAIGGAVKHIGNIHKYARAEDVPEHTLFVITTDGMENASRRFSADEVKRLIERQKEKYGWDFIFIGANIDAVETAGRIGISADRSANYTHDGIGAKAVFASVCKAVSGVRFESAVPSEWSEEVDADFENRGKKDD